MILCLSYNRFFVFHLKKNIIVSIVLFILIFVHLKRFPTSIMHSETRAFTFPAAAPSNSEHGAKKNGWRDKFLPMDVKRNILDLNVDPSRPQFRIVCQGRGSRGSQGRCLDQGLSRRGERYLNRAKNHPRPQDLVSDRPRQIQGRRTLQTRASADGCARVAHDVSLTYLLASQSCQ